jgi:hypothetical protein
MGLTRLAIYRIAVLVLAIALIVVWATGLPLGLRIVVAALLLAAVAGTIYERKSGNALPHLKG